MREGSAKGISSFSTGLGEEHRRLVGTSWLPAPARTAAWMTVGRAPRRVIIGSNRSASQSDPEERGYRVRRPANPFERCGVRSPWAGALAPSRAINALTKPNPVEGEGRQDGPAGSGVPRVGVRNGAGGRAATQLGRRDWPSGSPTFTTAPGLSSDRNATRPGSKSTTTVDPRWNAMSSSPWKMRTGGS